VLWVTRAHVHIDRVACPWLIRRFIDSEAHFIFVNKDHVAQVAAETGAIPFDAPGAELGHHEGKCSFEAILTRYGLTDAGLQRMARVVHAADISADRAQDPLAAGLEALATGFALLFPADALNLEKQFVVYDALYAWCRLHAGEA
jgi:hypothetical protein